MFEFFFFLHFIWLLLIWFIFNFLFFLDWRILNAKLIFSKNFIVIIRLMNIFFLNLNILIYLKNIFIIILIIINILKTVWNINIKGFIDCYFHYIIYLFFYIVLQIWITSVSYTFIMIIFKKLFILCQQILKLLKVITFYIIIFLLRIRKRQFKIRKIFALIYFFRILLIINIIGPAWIKIWLRFI